MKDKSIEEITRMIADLFDIIYFSARKFGFGRGGGIMVRDEALFHEMDKRIYFILLCVKPIEKTRLRSILHNDLLILIQKIK